ncbi:DegT/DnrJ/EryC1/StrS family aminotransferase [Micromonospora humi]|uniref:dTDP-4-amino-4,6-dideoxygalactose transaminase n=1 Tax=Micromonospora humi TaxID=745366 RepID=A0A1C5K7H3_9ACTN|nr:aminotransferase class I/II-fold pyridoxal phosphate-dependent enzyme [Micromonospora humi]SCG78667.1 dTDP-4-amino-4,6-dideoxygalactose transaminase [Micromonospora humi]
MTDRIYLSPPHTGPLEEQYLTRALRSGWVAPTGPDLDAFEREMTERLNTGHALAVSSGTAALHLALIAAGVRPGDAVVVPTFTFAATANATVYVGAAPVFVDCDPATGNIDPSLLAAVIDDLRSDGRRVAAVIAVDINGSCAEYADLLPICRSAGVPLVEDAAQALGSTYRGRPAGTFGLLGTFSFNGNKVLTTSSGGMVVSDDGALVDRCRHLSTQAREPVVHYEHRDVGYNYRLSNLLAALGRAQLRRLDRMIERRRALRESYAKLFAAVPGTRVLGEQDAESNCWLTSLVVDEEAAGWTATALGVHLAAQNIETRPLWKPLHRQPAYASCRAVVTGAADGLFASGITLPSGSALSEAQADRLFAAVESFLEAR